MSTLQLPCQWRICSSLVGRFNIIDLAIGPDNTSRCGSQVWISSKSIDYVVDEAPFGKWLVIVLRLYAQGI